jgi:hypothetical protein
MKTQKTSSSQSKSKQCWNIIRLDFKLYYRAIVKKKKTQHGTSTRTDIYQCSRIEDSELNPGSYSHLILDKGAKNTHGEKGILFNN